LEERFRNHGLLIKKAIISRFIYTLECIINGGYDDSIELLHCKIKMQQR